MTNKELIKEEIERIEQILDDFNKTHNNTIDNGIVLAKKNICIQIKSFIDSLPEEPKCIYNRTLDERKKFCKYCSAACDVRIEEEPVSEDLDEEILCRWDDYPHTLWPKCPYSDFKNIATHFANWQQQKDLEDSIKSDMTMPNKFYEKGKVDAMNEMKEILRTEYEKGRFDMREEMMKDSISCNVDWYDGFILDYTQEQQDDILLKLGAGVGDKVKIIIVKEGQQ